MPLCACGRVVLLEPDLGSAVLLVAAAGAVLFLVILEVGHVYAWRKGALEWD